MGRPTTDAGLLGWSVNFDEKISEDGESLGLTAGEIAAYHVVHQAYAAAYQTAINPDTRTKGAILAKRLAKKNLQKSASQLSMKIEGTAGITDQQLADLGLTIPDTDRQHVPAPQFAPMLDMVAMVGSTMHLRAHDSQNPNRRGKPAGVKGATFFSYVGDQPPTDPLAWKFEGSVTRTNKIEIEFDPSLEPGTKVWVIGFWFSPTSQSGPPSEPISARIQYGVVDTAA